MAETLLVNEIYLSLQGESTFAGLPCIFIRLTACNLRCSYCDTTYAFTEGRKMLLSEVRQEVLRLAEPHRARPRPSSSSSISTAPRTKDEDELRLPIVELTGGEPLLQPNVLPLMRDLCDDGFTVLIETSGAHDISGIDPRV